jgi:acetyltransferase
MLGSILHPLDSLFAPRGVALIGATDKEGSVGKTILTNLISSPFGGTVFPVNPKRPNVLGIKAYPTVGDIPDAVDLAVIVTPAPSVPALIGECVQKGVKTALVISAGFKETGAGGIELERQILEQARAANMRIVGPNCLGVMNTATGMNATFAGAMARKGKVGFISQSGALLTAVLDWSFREHVGFSKFVSVGSMLDVGWGDLIDYLGDDPQTESILIYMESVGDAQRFVSAAREVALTKPIIIIKPGQTEAAAKAAASHTGSLTGSDAVLDAAFRRCGVLRVNTIAELFYMAEVFAKQPRPKGPRMTVITNAGGPGVIASDALIANGGELAAISPETMTALNAFLPPAWSHNNPIDVLGDAGPERYAKTLEIAAQDKNSDGLLVILTPQDMTDPTATAKALVPYAKSLNKPVLASWMGGPFVQPGEKILNEADIPTFGYPDTAARTFDLMWRYTDNLRTLYETPMPASGGQTDRARANEIIHSAHVAGRTLLTEYESKQLLAAYAIPTVETELATNADEAVSAAQKLGYPVVLKLHSYTISHKTDVGGVKLNLQNDDDVREAYAAVVKSVTELAGAQHIQGATVQRMAKLDGYELILGSSIDPQFGPTLLFGTGGQLVEVYKDSSLALPPLTTTLARRLMERTKIYTALKGVRGRKPVDLAALEQLLVQFSQLVIEQPWIKEIDINPLLAGPPSTLSPPAPLPAGEGRKLPSPSGGGVGGGGLIALDARVLLHDAGVSPDALPRSAIRPYPIRYVSDWALKDGASVHIRPIRPEDEPMVIAFHAGLSEQSVYMRYLQPLSLAVRTGHDRMIRICFNDYDREIALVAERAGEIAGIGRLIKLSKGNAAEWAILIADKYQRKGLGEELLRRLVQIARDEKLSCFVADIHPENRGMQRVAQKVGFKLRFDGDEGLMKAELALT